MSEGAIGRIEREVLERISEDKKSHGGYLDIVLDKLMKPHIRNQFPTDLRNIIGEYLFGDIRQVMETILKFDGLGMKIIYTCINYVGRYHGDQAQCNQIFHILYNNFIKLDNFGGKVRRVSRSNYEAIYIIDYLVGEGLVSQHLKDFRFSSNFYDREAIPKCSNMLRYITYPDNLEYVEFWSKVKPIYLEPGKKIELDEFYYPLLGLGKRFFLRRNKRYKFDDIFGHYDSYELDDDYEFYSDSD